jgi:hypothetical protein
MTTLDINLAQGRISDCCGELVYDYDPVYKQGRCAGCRENCSAIYPEEDAVTLRVERDNDYQKNNLPL